MYSKEYDIKQELCNISYTLHDSYILMLRTQLYAYQFAATLNRLYGWELRRDANISVDEFGGKGNQHCPFYFHYDADSRLLFFLIENPSTTGGIDGVLNGYDKILVINGYNASNVMHQLYEDFTEVALRSTSNSGELGRQQWEKMRYEMASNDIIYTDYIDFSKCDDSRSNAFSINNIELISTSKRNNAIYSNLADKNLYNKEKAKGMSLSKMHVSAQNNPLLKVKTSMFDLQVGTERLQTERLRYLEQLKNVSNQILHTIEIVMDPTIL
ncbi:MAG: hypothetical protein SPJ13_06165 [Bacteroidales bacterium]|nr:hypothetical protein [Bacteroidales bacterium]